MKRKTKQALAKRITITRRGTVLHRAAGQDHFNARESGVTSKRKRRDKTLSPAFRRAVQAGIPGF